MNKGGRRLIELTQIHVKNAKEQSKSNTGEGWEKQSGHTIPGGGEVGLTREPTQKTGAESSLEKRAIL